MYILQLIDKSKLGTGIRDISRRSLPGLGTSRRAGAGAEAAATILG